MLNPSPITIATGGTTSAYRETIDLAQRFAHTVMESLNTELDRNDIEISATQAMILVRLGDDEVSASILDRDCHLGTNAAHNLKRLVECGYLERKRRRDDGRMVKIRATPKGREVALAAADLFARQARMLEGLGDYGPAEAEKVNTALRRLTASLTELIVFRQV